MSLPQKTKMVKIELDENFDFGFSIVDEAELEAVQKVQTQLTTVSTTAATAETKLTKLYKAIQPLLNNLKKNPEKDYILWPNRVTKIEKFQDHLDSIYFSEE